jgi:AraC family transcriptional regulator of adaptative response/methylated-DNA-[protein]-cysteine methyltransferase
MSTKTTEAARTTIRYALGCSPLGPVLVARSSTGICAVLFGEDDAALTDDLAGRFPGATLIPDATALADPLAAVLRRLDGHDAAPLPPLDMGGSAFQRRVWQALQEIPPGRTASYRDVAERIGAPHAQRAIARACGANRLAVLVPCHRVVRADGGLSGYRWGAARKRALLAREAGR